MSDIVERLRNTPNWMREEFGSWKSAMRSYDRAPFEAADEIETLRAALKSARRDALEEAAKWHDEKAQIWKNTYAKDTLSSPDMQPARIQCLERYGFHIIAATDIRALKGEGNE